MRQQAHPQNHQSQLNHGTLPEAIDTRDTGNTQTAEATKITPQKNQPWHWPTKRHKTNVSQSALKGGKNAPDQPSQGNAAT